MVDFKFVGQRRDPPHVAEKIAETRIYGGNLSYEVSQEEAAIEALDGAEWYGRDLKVNKARPREERGGGNRNRSSFAGRF